MSNPTDVSRNERPAAFITVLGLCAVVLGFAIAKRTGVVDYGLAKRGVAVALGLLLIAAGNFIPKFRLFDAPGRDPARIHSAERLAGWTLVLVGIAYVAIWLLAPVAGAMLVSSIVGLAGFGIVGLAWMRAAGSSGAEGAPRATPTGESALARRILLATVLVTVLWSVVIFLVDYLWGDTASQWAAVVYSLVLGLVVSVIVPMHVLRQGDSNPSG